MKSKLSTIIERSDPNRATPPVGSKISEALSVERRSPTKPWSAGPERNSRVDGQGRKR
jgi:hypothetical protein